MYLSLYLFFTFMIHTYMHVCVCACICMYVSSIKKEKSRIAKESVGQKWTEPHTRTGSGRKGKEHSAQDLMSAELLWYLQRGQKSSAMFRKHVKCLQWKNVVKQDLGSITQTESVMFTRTPWKRQCPGKLQLQALKCSCNWLLKSSLRTFVLSPPVRAV